MSPATQMITGVDFVTIFCTDFEAAVRFYGEVLGLPCSTRYGKVDGAEFETGNLTLSVLSAEAIGREFKPSPGPVALHVDDVEASRTELEGRGVSFNSDSLDSGVCHMAIFSDPDGNQLMLHHRYAPRDSED